MLYVYILKCSDKSYYTGITNDPEVRLLQHNNGINSKTYTYTRRPVEMLYCSEFTDYHDAVLWEKQIKKWTRKKKEALIKGDWDRLKELAACKNHTSHKNIIELNTEKDNSVSNTSFDSAQDGIPDCPSSFNSAKDDKLSF